MKKIFKLIGIIALVTVIGFSMACGEGDDGNGNENGNENGNGNGDGNGNGTQTPVAPAIITAILPGGEVGEAYSQTLTATGDAPITWSKESGTLPNGFTFSAEGVISGTPTTIGTSIFTVKATNATGSDTKQLSITVIEIPIFTSITSFATWLEEQPANTTATSYRVKLKVNDLGGNYSTTGSAGETLRNNDTKYVSLDLSGSTFTSIEWAFAVCYSLTSVTIGNSVTSIGYMAFYGCTNLTSVTIPDSVTSIGSDAFYACTSLANITIPNSVTSIEYRAFSYCTSLANITIPNSVTSIEHCAFEACTSLTAINVDTANTAYSSLDGVLYNKAKTTLIQYPAGKTGNTFTIPNSVTSIGDSAFSSCTSLTSVTIGNSVTSIGEWAFSYCTSLTSVTIGNSVTSIGEWAFSNCTSLTSVTIGNSVTSIEHSAFEDCTSLTSVTFQGTIPSSGFAQDITSIAWGLRRTFPGDLRDKYFAVGGGIGTYTRPSGSDTWTKQP